MEFYVKNIWKKGKILGKTTMIFVTIGTMYGYPRLINEMDNIARDIDEEVIMQIGETTYEPNNAKYFRFCSREEMSDIIEKSRIVVCHAGVGSIMSAIEHAKPVIVIPRRKEYNEVIDDHQLEIARELEKDGIVKAVYDLKELKNILNVPINFYGTLEKENLLSMKLREYLNQLNENI